MGNCSFRSATDSSSATARSTHHANNVNDEHRRPQQEAVRVTAISPVKCRTTCDGVWKVKLVIDPKELGQILAEEVNTEALIQQMRIAANSTPRRGGKGHRSGGLYLYGSHFLTNVCTTV